MGEFTTFVDNIWRKIKKDSQYQLEKVQDWTAHFKHLESILIEFVTDCTLLETLLGQYFYEDLRPLIKVWINKDGQELFTWNDLIKKKSRAEAKAKI